MKHYAIATETNIGQIVKLDLPLMSRNVAERHAKKLRDLMPNARVFVINVNAE